MPESPSSSATNPQDGSPETPATATLDPFLQALVESSENAVLTGDLDARITSWNPAAERLYGWTAAEAIGRTIDLIVVDPAELELSFAALKQGRQIEAHDTRRRRRDGAMVDVSLCISPVRDASGRLIGAAAIACDISRRRQAESASRLSELRYRTVVSQLPDAAVYEYDRDFRIVTAEGPLLERSGWTAESVRGRTPWELLPVEDAERFADHYMAALAGETRAFELPSSTGGTLDVDTFPLRDPEDAARIVGAVAFTRDVTDRKRIEQDLHVQAQLLDRLEVAVVVTDPNGRVTHWNRQAGLYYARPREEAVGQELATLAPLYDFPDPTDLLARLRGEGVARLEHRVERSDGEAMDLFVTGSVIDDESGDVAGFVWVATDITASREAEAEKRRLEARLHQAQKLDAIGRLAGGIAHDFNNLLAVILNYADFVATGLDPASPLQEEIAEVTEAAERAAALTRQLLLFGRREVVRPSAVDVDDVVAGTERLLRRTIGEDIDIETALAGDLRPVCADRSHLEQVILNLALNGRDAMPEGGRLRIATANVELGAAAARGRGVAPGRFVRLTVEDTGAGMPADVADQAFEPFFTTKPATLGTGLGLATVYGIINRGDGTIELSSTPGTGTIVTVWLPVSERSAPDDAEPESAVVRGGGETVLVVEDTPAVRRVATRLLRDAGYRVLHADADEALELAVASRPDLLLTDVVMPGLSGSELAEAVRARLPQVAVLFMSGYTDDVVMRHGVIERRLAFLEKPFTSATLLRAVRDTLDRSAGDDVRA